LKKKTLEVIEDGIMTGDLALIAEPKASRVVNSWEFIDEIAKRL